MQNWSNLNLACLSGKGKFYKMCASVNCYLNIRLGKEENEPGSLPSQIYNTILNSPKLFRRTVTLSNDNSPRPTSPLQNQNVRKITRDELTCSRSAPNTPGSRRHLLPRYRHISGCLSFRML
jgi:hypothetical protein